MTGRDPGTGQTYVPNSRAGTTGPRLRTMPEVRVAMRRAFGMPCDGPGLRRHRSRCISHRIENVEWNGVRCDTCPIRPGPDSA